MSKRDSKGNRIKRTEPFILLEKWILDTDAWVQLPPISFKVMACLAKRHDGRNNGRISMSVREASQETGCAINTAAKALLDLQRLGFIAVTTPGGFSLKTRHATEWELLWERTGSDLAPVPARKDFARIRSPEKQYAVAKNATDGLKN